LAKEGSDRRGEAADGLERVARAAIASNDRGGLSAALAGLKPLASGRALGTFAGPLARGIADGTNSADALTVLPVAAASAPDARQQDSLMLQYARALTRAGRCEEASAAFEALARRQRDPGVVRASQQGLGQCVLALGRQAVEQGQPQKAEDWFRRAVSEGGDAPLARSAYLGLGDVMLARGDYAGAADAYLRATQGAPPGDTVAEQARQKLGNLSNAGTVVR
jgi:tetratricopeptide (TPR) repeat protein